MFVFLERRLGSDCRFGWFSEDERRELADEWMRCSDAIDARKKLLVERNGLCLLLAYLINGIQGDAFDAEEQQEPWNRRN